MVKKRESIFRTYKACQDVITVRGSHIAGSDGKKCLDNGVHNVSTAAVVPNVTYLQPHTTQKIGSGGKRMKRACYWLSGEMLTAGDQIAVLRLRFRYLKHYPQTHLPEARFLLFSPHYPYSCVGP